MSWNPFTNTPFDPSTWDPSTWHLPTETPTTFDPPPQHESRYQIGIINHSQGPVVVRCVAWNNNQWVGNWNITWVINVGEQKTLDYSPGNPVLGVVFHLAAITTDNSVNWGHPNAPLTLNVGPPYITTGGYHVAWATLA